jgi:hypothetical protein
MERLASFRQHSVPAKSLKALEILERLTSQDNKVVVWSNFLSNLDQFSELVRVRLGVACFQIDGRVPTGDEAESDAPGSGSLLIETDTRERIINRFLSFDGPAVLVTNPASCSESISLHSVCHHAIYLDRTYDCGMYLQSIDRIHRLGLPPETKTEIHLIRARLEGRATIDELVHAALLRKDARMKQLLESAELLPLGELDAAKTAEGSEQDLGDLVRFLLGERGAS